MKAAAAAGTPAWRRVEEAWSLWVDAYHESLAWQSYDRTPRTSFEEALDRELVNLAARLTPTGRVDPDSVGPFLEEELVEGAMLPDDDGTHEPASLRTSP